jgi:hypothetical protein
MTGRNACERTLTPCTTVGIKALRGGPTVRSFASGSERKKKTAVWAAGWHPYQAAAAARASRPSQRRPKMKIPRYPRRSWPSL